MDTASHDRDTGREKGSVPTSTARPSAPSGARSARAQNHIAIDGVVGKPAASLLPLGGGRAGQGWDTVHTPPFHHGQPCMPAYAPGRAQAQARAGHKANRIQFKQIVNHMLCTPAWLAGTHLAHTAPPPALLPSIVGGTLPGCGHSLLASREVPQVWPSRLPPQRLSACSCACVACPPNASKTDGCDVAVCIAACVPPFSPHAPFAAQGSRRRHTSHTPVAGLMAARPPRTVALRSGTSVH